jgi:hypothetical protein
MNSRVMLAFIAGLIFASGVTYYLVKPRPPAPVQAAQANMPSAVPATPAASESPELAQPAAPAPTQTVTAPEPAPAKPSPAVRRAGRVAHRPQPAPATIARNEPAPVPAPPSTASAPPAVNAPAPAPASQPEPAEKQPDAPAPIPVPNLPPPPPEPNHVTIPAGTLLTVRLSETLSTERNQPGDQFSAVLDQPLVVDGFVIAEKGARAQGRIVELNRSGKVRGLAELSIELTQFRSSDGQTVKINTAAFKRQAESTKKSDAAKIGVGAAIGAAIGAIAGGGKGAAIGAGVGGAAGAGDVMLTRGKAAELPVETRVSFRLSEPVTITERLK